MDDLLKQSLQKLFTNHNSGGYHDSRYLLKTSVINSNSVTEEGYALDARQANPTISGSLAYQIEEQNTNLEGLFKIVTGTSDEYTIEAGGEAIIQINREIPDGFKAVAINFASTGNPYVLSRYTSASTGVMRLRNINGTTAQTGVASMDVLCVKQIYM